MPNELQVDVIAPGSCKDCQATVDAKLVEAADRLLYDDMPTRDKVWVLHYTHGWPMRKIAKALGVSHQAIHKHCVAIEADMEQAPANPQAPKRRAILRERLEAQYARAMEMPDTERSVVLALKTLEVMAKLDGLNLEAQADDAKNIVPYSPPPEVAQEVKTLMLERWGRKAGESQISSE